MRAATGTKGPRPQQRRQHSHAAPPLHSQTRTHAHTHTHTHTHTHARARTVARDSEGARAGPRHGVRPRQIVRGHDLPAVPRVRIRNVTDAALRRRARREPRRVPCTRATHVNTRKKTNKRRKMQAHTTTHTHSLSHTHRHTDTDTHTQTHRHTDTDTHTQTHRHTDTHTHTHTHRRTHRGRDRPVLGESVIAVAPFIHPPLALRARNGVECAMRSAKGHWNCPAIASWFRFAPTSMRPTRGVAATPIARASSARTAPARARAHMPQRGTTTRCTLSSGEQKRQQGAWRIPEALGDKGVFPPRE